MVNTKVHKPTSIISYKFLSATSWVATFQPIQNLTKGLHYIDAFLFFGQDGTTLEARILGAMMLGDKQNWGPGQGPRGQEDSGQEPGCQETLGQEAWGMETLEQKAVK